MALAVSGGVLVVVSFPPVGLGPLLWPAVAMLVAALRGHGWRERCLLGFGAGLAIEGGGFYWIAGTVNAYGQDLAGGEIGDGPLVWLGWGAFSLWWATAAVFWVIWGALALSARSLAWRLLWPAISFTALESFFPRIFPWNLGAGLAGWDALAQAARWFGVAGTTWLCVVAGSLLSEGVHALAAGRRRAGAALLACLLAGASLWWGAGAARLAAAPAATRLRVGYVQPNVPLAERHSGNSQTLRAIVRKLAGLSLSLEREKPDIVVWPEAIFPVPLEPQQMLELFQGFPFPLVAGAPGPANENRAYYIARDAAGTPTMSWYDKRVLLCFGERFPLRSVIAGLGLELPASDLRAGMEAKVFRAGGVDFGISICFEGILADTAPDLVRAGARVHVNVTEDLWFGDTSEPHQHLALSAMRAVEAELPLVRVTNAGFSAYVDAMGRIAGRTELMQASAGVYEVAVADAVPPPPWTQKLPVLSSWGAFPVLIAYALVHRRRERRRTTE